MNNTKSHIEFNNVYCDACNTEYFIDSPIDKNLPYPSGVKFSSYAYCPLCAERIVAGAKKYNEEKYLIFPSDQSMGFFNFVIKELRNGEMGSITIISFDNDEDFINNLLNNS